MLRFFYRLFGELQSSHAVRIEIAVQLLALMILALYRLQLSARRQ